ncbi:hypothetical protein JCM33374_g1952 [Metschnikowia sp. JCM 33374]|nr:hypothetical protein JCM33374_g1952 [Metschnikowia sp. JCM 33374]
MAPSLAPIQGVARLGVVTAEPSAASGPSGYLTSTQAHADLHGAGHLGVAPLDRIIMSLKSGLESEIEHALSTLTFYSCNDPKLVDFTSYPLIGTELIAFFVRPYHLLNSDASGSNGSTGPTGHSGSNGPSANSANTIANAAKLTPAVLSASVESLLSLRNAAQDLHNQQWLCQVPHFRRYAVDALKFLNAWFFSPSVRKSYTLDKASDSFRESLKHLLDVLDPLTCFYVETPKNDPLFHQLLVLLTHTNDKSVLMVVLKCLQHLLFLGGAGGLVSRNPDEPDCNNCIDAVQSEHLQVIVRSLLVNDDELNYAVLSFLKQYLSSEALHAQYKSSPKQSQLYRLKKLVDVVNDGSQSNLHVLLKQLPELTVARLPLVDPAQMSLSLPLQLKKRSTYSGVPTVTAKLPQGLYDILLTFPEPLRATTWLRCCYEPHTIPPKERGVATESSAGEVTQISLWKSYENQFEAIWKDRFNPKWPNLLPAVDFIKNVSTAFPNSEAMVVNVPTTDPAQPARKKFIIKGIQPRQFPVTIDIGNFEALRKNHPLPEDKSASATEVGDVDSDTFKDNMNAFVESILSASEGLTDAHDINAPWYSPINLLSKDILGVIISSLLEGDTDGKYRNVFRQYNKGWLPDLVFANPGLIEQSYIDGKWLQYLL